MSWRTRPPTCATFDKEELLCAGGCVPNHLKAMVFDDIDGRGCGCGCAMEHISFPGDKQTSTDWCVQGALAETFCDPRLNSAPVLALSVNFRSLRVYIGSTPPLL